MPSRRSKAREIEAFLSPFNALSETAFTKYLPQTHTITTKDNSTTYPYTFHKSQNLSKKDFEACFRLIQETSSADYKAASQGWDPKYKREEMREPDMRYILLRSDTESKGIVAFVSFMLTLEEEEAVVYIYEIHLTSGLRGTGVGKALVGVVESIGRAVGVKLSMLTVFTSNTHAEAFYRYLGYTEDPSSPRERKLRSGTIKRPEFLILSKSLEQVSPAKRIKLTTDEG
jgi:ribosomal protein S18 acetylase RimI-like enzyme